MKRKLIFIMVILVVIGMSSGMVFADTVQQSDCTLTTINIGDSGESTFDISNTLDNPSMPGDKGILKVTITNVSDSDMLIEPINGVPYISLNDKYFDRYNKGKDRVYYEEYWLTDCFLINGNDSRGFSIESKILAPNESMSCVLNITLDLTKITNIYQCSDFGFDYTFKATKQNKEEPVINNDTNDKDVTDDNITTTNDEPIIITDKTTVGKTVYKTNSPKKTHSPQTGDNGINIGWYIVMAITAIGIIFIIRRKNVQI